MSHGYKQVLKDSEEETEGNRNDLQRQMGCEIRYGSAVMLLHVSSNTMLTFSKLQSVAEPLSHAVMLVREPTIDSIFQLHPAFKVSTLGSPVTSGDFIILGTRKIAGVAYRIHMSGNSTANRIDIDRKLAMHDSFIMQLAEINAAQVLFVLSLTALSSTGVCFACSLQTVEEAIACHNLEFLPIVMCGLWGCIFKTGLNVLNAVTAISVWLERSKRSFSTWALPSLCHRHSTSV